MRLLAVSAVIVAAVWVTPAAARQGFVLKDPARLEPVPPKPTLSFRITDDFAPEGIRRQRRGILAGVQVAPQTMVGVGFFDSVPKVRGLGFESRVESHTKRSRKAAVGMSFRF